ncbi:MAG: iron-sulfur cluster assembly accessory protein [Bacteroidota bacterium]|nr:iron-sulfur cluster assembly accessory protein [Bacteroidota bacterium]MDX5429799.1 iron-sulfur cluster assembly accessory protein [Bacteroidota bacterium]MDX5468578.1 iron-sulfur cluster assembly accessory protein [Bacteroidota bacterium]
MSIPVRISSRALAQIRTLRSSMNLNEDTYLRIGVKGGKGCMVVEKMIGFDQKTEQDEVFDVEDIQVLIRKGESLYLAGLEIDYVEDGNSRGFVFSE